MPSPNSAAVVVAAGGVSAGTSLRSSLVTTQRKGGRSRLKVSGRGHAACGKSRDRTCASWLRTGMVSLTSTSAEAVSAVLDTRKLGGVEGCLQCCPQPGSGLGRSSVLAGWEKITETSPSSLLAAGRAGQFDPVARGSCYG
jgi:hypothetical protein